MQTFSEESGTNFCTKLENADLCRLFRKNPARISAQNLKKQIYADFFGQFRLALLHKNAILNFLQKTPANRREKLCTKTQFCNLCRKHPRIVAKNSAQKRNSAIFAENTREPWRRRPDLLTIRAREPFYSRNSARKCVKKAESRTFTQNCS